MSKKIQAIRGMNDLLPKDSNLWLAMEGVINKLLISYGYIKMLGTEGLTDMKDLMVKHFLLK